MIEEITPQVMAISMVIILFCAPIITALICAIALRLYKRAVLQAMAANSHSSPIQKSFETDGFNSPVSRQPAATPAPADGLHYNHATEAPRGDAAVHTLAVVAAMLPMSLAFQINYPNGFGATGVILGLWIYSWASVPMLLLILPNSLRTSVALISFYFIGYGILCVYATSINTISAIQVGGIDIAERSGVTPAGMILLWLSANAVPTLLCWLCFNRRVRAVAPSVLALVSLFITGLWFSWLWAWMPRSDAAVSNVSEALGTTPAWINLTVAAVVLIGLVLGARYLIRAIAKAYRRKALSDRSLNLASVFAVFITMYTMWLTVGVLLWILLIPLSASIYWGVLTVMSRFRSQPKEACALCFLRVFSLGSRSQGLLDGLAKYWRNIGNVQMITGPDVATGTVQPHQFLDFLSGDLLQHFIGNQEALDTAATGLRQKRDPDGRFRVNSLFCYEDTWQLALRPLVADNARVLMDLRSFSEANSGCRDELFFVAAQIPFRQCLLAVDKTTDRAYLNTCIADALGSAPQDSCNAGRAGRELRQLEFKPGDTQLRLLLKELLS